MTEVRHWLDANAQRLSELASDLGVPPDMVHLTAVLVLGGLTDRQIEEQLRSVRWGEPLDGATVAAVLRALGSVRAAATRDVWPHDRIVDIRSAGHRVLSHTADCIIEAWGPDRAACLTEALTGLVEEFAGPTDAPAPDVLPLGVGPGPAEEQLVSLFEEVIYDLDVLSVVPVSFHLAATEDGAVAGDMEVVPVERVAMVGPVPKAVTYHDLYMRGDREGWRCRVLIDI